MEHLAFFEPTPEFIAWIKNFAKDRLIVDCGCGNGNLTFKLIDMDLQAIGIDAWPDERIDKHPHRSSIMKFDATKFEYPMGCLPIMARPNRGTWIHLAMRRALETTDCFIYIGLEKHIDKDIHALSDKEYHTEEVMKKAGKENEIVYAITLVGERSNMLKLNPPMIIPGPPCTECQCMEFYKPDSDLEYPSCTNCHTEQLPGVNPNEAFDFTLHGDPSGEQHYQVSIKKIKKNTMHDYLRYRLSSGADRVYYHRILCQEAGVTGRHTNWFLYFENWIEEFLSSEIGHHTYTDATAENCIKCNRRLIIGDARYCGDPKGSICWECYKGR